MSERKIITTITPQDDEVCGECERLDLPDGTECPWVELNIDDVTTGDVVAERGPLCLSAEREHAALVEENVRLLEERRKMAEDIVAIHAVTAGRSISNAGYRDAVMRLLKASRAALKGAGR